MYKLKEDPFSSHSKIAKIIKSNLTSGDILDIGCGGGFIGALLPRHLYNIYGIDANKELLIEAQKVYKKGWCLDIEKETPPINLKFDLLIFADILEHLQDPITVLRNYLNYGKSGCLIVISTPNVANIAIRLSLLFGHFNYYERGILDKTHLRFFTLSTFKKMLAEAGLEILQIKVTPLPLPEVLPLAHQGKPLFGLCIILNKLASFWGTLFAYQFIVLARRK